MTKPATARTNRRNRAKYDTITTRLPKGGKKNLDERMAAAYGDDRPSLNSFVVAAINEKLERDIQ